MNPLNLEIVGGELVLRIGVDTLKFAAENMPDAQPFNEQKKDFEQAWRVIDKDAFAKDVLSELLREEEDGSNPITRMFDQAFLSAIENGSEGIELADEND